MAKKLLLIVMFIKILIILNISNAMPDKNSYEIKNILINEHLFQVEIADTPEKIALGLSGRSLLNANQGMLFIFKDPKRVSFWMKDMKFPLDIIWIKNGKVMGFVNHAPIPKHSTAQLIIYDSPVIVDSVLELVAGTVSKVNIRVGDPLKIVP